MNEDNGEGLPRVLAVVVTHEGRPWLAESLHSLAGQSYPALDTFVFDNASSQDPSGAVAEILAGAEFYRSDTNLGFGAAANRALELSEVAPDCEFFLFLHDDTALDPDCVANLVLAAVDTGAGAVGGKGLAWDGSGMLVEAGMTSDQFGYSFTGLEDGEIDQGQHDERREVLYATSACILVSRSLVERTGSWDGDYFIFGEDLDLCLRGRLAGYPIIFEPSARFRHAAALANRGRASSSSREIRFYTRRNRMRTILKDMSLMRSLILLPIYLGLMGAEILVLAALRRFDEVTSYPRAVGSFVLSIPDILRRRRAVQRRRAVPDRRLRRLMVSDLHRARVFLERRLRQFERETIDFGEMALSRFTPSALREGFLRLLRHPATLIYAIVGVLLLVAARHLLVGPTIAAGGLWPFPESSSRLISDYFAGWRDIGLGTEAAAPPLLPLAWVLQALTPGGARAAQSVSVLLMMTIGIVGMARLVRGRTSMMWAQVGAVLLYAFGPVTMLALAGADLAAMAVFAGAPWMLGIAMRMLGPTPSDDADRPATPPRMDDMLRDCVRLGLVTALVVAAAPSALMTFLFAWLLLGAGAAVAAWDTREAMRRGLWVLASLSAAVVILLPWSLEGLRPAGTILGPILSGLGGGPMYAPSWSARSYSDLIFLVPEAPLVGGYVTAAVWIGSLTLIPDGRRREVRRLSGLWLGFALIGGAAVAGWGPAPAATSGSWLIVPQACLAMMAGHLIAGLRRELPRHGLGLKHLATGLVILVTIVGLVPWIQTAAALDTPVSTGAADTSDEAHSILSFFTSTAEQVGEFRILWLGDAWVGPLRPAMRPLSSPPYIVTGPEGVTILQALAPPPAEGERRLDRLVGGLVARRLHLAGHVLAPAGIRYIVVSDKDAEEMASMSRQRDIALQQQQGGIAIFENELWVPRSALAPTGLAAASASGDSEVDLMLSDWMGGRTIPARSQSRFTGQVPRTRHPMVLLADNFNPGWEATVDGDALEHHVSFGWANRFDLPDDALGPIEVVFKDSWHRWIWLAAQATLILLAVQMARGGRRDPSGWLR